VAESPPGDPARERRRAERRARRVVEGQAKALLDLWRRAPPTVREAFMTLVREEQAR
jgi:hypothetical protein